MRCFIVLIYEFLKKEVLITRIFSLKVDVLMKVNYLQKCLEYRTACYLSAIYLQVSIVMPLLKSVCLIGLPPIDGSVR